MHRRTEYLSVVFGIVGIVGQSGPIAYLVTVTDSSSISRYPMSKGRFTQKKRCGFSVLLLSTRDEPYLARTKEGQLAPSCLCNYIEVPEFDFRAVLKCLNGYKDQEQRPANLSGKSYKHDKAITTITLTVSIQ